MNKELKVKRKVLKADLVDMLKQKLKDTPISSKNRAPTSVPVL